MGNNSQLQARTHLDLEQTVWEKNGGLGLASREMSQGYLTNERGNKKTFGAEKKHEQLELEQSKMSQNC